jgi:hypothetical protein
MLHLGDAANAFQPSDSDWLVSLVFKDGRTVVRRVCPGVVSEEQAVMYAVAAEVAKVSDIDAWSIRRVSDRSIAAPDDAFQQLLRRRM